MNQIYSTSVDYTLEELDCKTIVCDEDPLISQVNVTIGGPVTIFCCVN